MPRTRPAYEKELRQKILDLLFRTRRSKLAIRRKLANKVQD